jgi:hypothetical protein
VRGADLSGSFPVDDEELDGPIGYREAYTGDLFARDFEFDFSRMIDEHTVTSASDVEGDTFIGLLAGSATV